MSSLLLLDLGCGAQARVGYVGVDLAGGDIQMDLANGMSWPWADDSVDGFHSSHMIEHIRADYVYPSRSFLLGQDAFMFFFDEAYRIAKPGALFELSWPCLKSVWAFQDPTHRRYIPVETLSYLSREAREALRVPGYAKCDWVLEDDVKVLMPGGVSVYDPSCWDAGLEYRALLRALK